ncbi:hypothetical protein DMJ13_12620 [halophilic archaeon]|nr:hypothetical protein DMJ13_12620 [halophilic archaeon]
MSDDEEPLADLAAEVDRRRDREREADDDAFTEVDVAAVDREKLWADLRGETAPGRTAAGEAEDDDARDVRTVDKSICHGCPHFGDPPALRCTHDGTDILSVVDSGRFRVADCPVVVEESELDLDATEFDARE